MKPLVLLSTDQVFVEHLKLAFDKHAPEFPVLFANDPAAIEAEVAACWFPPTGSIAGYPRLRLIHSVAAGVDHLGDEALGSRVPVCRVVDPAHRQGMTEYVRWAVIHFQRNFDRVLTQQAGKCWLRHSQTAAPEYQVGVMGLGSLGGAIADDLAASGYRVRGWARTARQLEGMHTFSGEKELPEFLDGLDLLINLLPLTESTRGILGRQTFSYLAQNAAVVNCGRGQHLVVDDLVSAVKSGRLRGAVLDVFEREPLPPESPLWNTPGIVVTPHMASGATLDCIVRQVTQNIRSLQNGEPLMNTVNPALGY